MILLQIAIAIAAISLFLLFVAQPLLFAGRVLGNLGSSRRGRGRVTLEDFESSQNAVDAEVAAWIERGREFGQKNLAKVSDGAGGFRYEYTGPDAPEARASRAGKTRRARPKSDRNSPAGHLALGWKGFDADSSAWEVLGVARDASIREIKAAYRRLITKFHPDRFQHLSDGEIVDLERDTKLIHAAYAKLAKS